MAKASVDITQKEPGHFRVLEFGPNPIPGHSPFDELVLRIDCVSRPGTNIGLTRETYAPYRDAIAEAIESGAVYWVDWDYSKTPTFPPRMNATTLHRLLEAIKNRQMVSLRFR